MKSFKTWLEDTHDEPRDFSPDELGVLVPILRQEAPGVVLEASGGIALGTVILTGGASKVAAGVGYGV